MMNRKALSKTMIDRNYVSEIVLGISARKKEHGIEPCFATKEEVMAHVRGDVVSTLARLSEEGAIRQRRTINGVSYECR